MVLLLIISYLLHLFFFRLREDPEFVQHLHPVTVCVYTSYCVNWYSAVGYNIPSQACVTLQFYPREKGGAAMFRTGHRNQASSYCLGANQTLALYNNHMVFRKDEGYLFPYKYFIRKLMLSNAFPEYNMTKQDRHMREFDNVSFTYFHGNHFKIRQNIQVDFSMQQKLIQRDTCCKMSIIAPPIIFVPIRFTITSHEISGNRSKDPDYAFSFGKFFADTSKERWSSWTRYSFSWVSSNIYHINCSENLSETADNLGLSTEEVALTCTENIITFHAQYWECLLPPNTHEVTQTTGFVLNITIPGTTMVQLQVVKLTFQTIINELCKFTTVKTAQGRQPFLCTEYAAQNNLYASMLDRDSSFQIQLKLHEFTKVSLTLNSSIWAKNQMYSCVESKYSWKATEQALCHVTHKVEYRLFLREQAQSWTSAFIECSSRSLKLPSLRNQAQLDEIVALMHRHHKLTPLGFFIALIRMVSTKT